MVRSLKRVLHLWERLQGKTYVAAVLALVLSVAVFKVAADLRIVHVREGEDVQVVYTMKEEPGEILRESGIAVTAHDDVDFRGFEGPNGEISITRAYPVTVVADGSQRALMTTSGTVEELLQAANVELGESDRVSHDLEDPVGENDVITVIRQEQATVKMEEEIPYDVRVVRTARLEPGVCQVTEEGEPGLRVGTYQQTTVEGEVVEQVLVSDLIVRAPVDETRMEGFPATPVSPFDFEWEFDENGEPVGYKDVLRQVRAAGYSAKAGAGTASGRPAIVGNVAVDPRQIPYGSKLYIESVDGSFVYGYAVAADTGTALMEQIIQVDLFYDTYEGSARNGIKDVNIFILE